jgi:hypothetical protein
MSRVSRSLTSNGWSKPPKRQRYPWLGQEPAALPRRLGPSNHPRGDHEGARVDGSISITKSNHSADVPRMSTRYSSCLETAVSFSACPAEEARSLAVPLTTAARVLSTGPSCQSVCIVGGTFPMADGLGGSNEKNKVEAELLHHSCF